MAETSVRHSDVGLEVRSKLQEAVAGNYSEVASVLHRIDPAVEDVAFLELEAGLSGLQERRLAQLLGVEGHPAVVPRTDRTMDHEVVVSVAVGLVGLDAWKFGM